MTEVIEGTGQLDPDHATCPVWPEEHHENLRAVAKLGASNVLSGYVRSGNGWRVANEIDEMASIAAQIGGGLYCLGTKGDAAHAAEGGYSDHNAIVRGPDGLLLVRAIDFGGPMALLKQLRQAGWARYAAKDPANYYYGYQKGCDDNLINGWGLPFETHEDDGDAGHLHWSVNQSSYPSVAGGYVAAIDGRTGIGLRDLIGGGAPAPAPTPAPASGEKLWQNYPVPALIARGTEQYFGDIAGPAASHGGYFDSEKGLVKVLQQRLVACSFVPGHSDPDDGWCDGIFEQPTTDAVTRFQQGYMPGTEFYGQVWWDDWTKLFSL